MDRASLLVGLLTFMAVASLVACLLVLYSYGKLRALRRHPNTIIITRW